MTCKDKKERKRPCAAYRNVLHKVLNRQLFFVRNNLGAHPDVVVRFFGRRADSRCLDAIGTSALRFSALSS